MSSQISSHLPKVFIAFLVVTGLLNCGYVQITEEGQQTRVVTEENKVNCKYLSNVVSGAGDYYSSYDLNFESGFNAAMNTVASAGGDAYSILRSNETGTIYEMEVWHCGWKDSQPRELLPQSSDPNEISEEEREKCEYVKTVADGSNWGVTKSNNFQGARNAVLKLVKESGADSYFVVHKLENKYGVGLIVEAWRCR